MVKSKTLLYFRMYLGVKLCYQSSTHVTTFTSLSSARQVIMQHDPTRPSPVLLLCERRPPSSSPRDPPPHNFAETLPTEMSVKIFCELDAESLCSASCTCKLWHDIIEESEQLWRKQCLLVRAICQREVDSDRRDGLSWKVSPHPASKVQPTRVTLTPTGEHPQLTLVKTRTGTGCETGREHNVTAVPVSCPQVTLVRNYTRSCLKRDWLSGRYSHVRSAEELSGRRMTPLDAETWGEILQAELDR